MAGLPIRRAEQFETASLHHRAMNNLEIIRHTMTRSSSFTAVPGRGMIAMGITAFIGSYAASLRLYEDWWIGVWCAVGVAAWIMGTIAMVRKARRNGIGVFSAPGRRFLLGLSPPIVVGVVLTQVFYQSSLDAFLPGTWLMLYGAAVISGGVFSIPVVPAMGALFMILGHLAFFLPLPGLVLAQSMLPVDVLMALGFGGLHVAFGTYIAARHGG